MSDTTQIRNRKFLPSTELRPYIKHYMWVEFPNVGQTFWVPSDSRNLILNVFEGGAIIESNNKQYNQPQNAIRGAFTHDMSVHFEGKRIVVVGTAFTPIGLYHITGKPTTHYANRFDEASLYLPISHHQYDEALRAVQANPALADKVLNSVYESCLRSSNKATNQTFIKALHAAQELQGNIKAKELAEKLEVHPKTLKRYFENYTGVAVKKYLNLLQFEETCRILLKEQQTDLMEVAEKQGYFDQSHFIHAFKKMAGRLPSKIDTIDTSWISFLMENE